MNAGDRPQQLRTEGVTAVYGDASSADALARGRRDAEARSLIVSVAGMTGMRRDDPDSRSEVESAHAGARAHGASA